MTASDSSAQRRLYLRATVKLLVTAGLVFLLVPFIKSLPWPKAETPADATVLAETALTPGETRKIELRNGMEVYVTRASPALKEALRRFPPDLLWFASAPGLTEQDWFVVQAVSALDEPVQFLPPQGHWPGGFVAAGGAAWDLAGRALKPWPGHPTGSPVKSQNLLPMPFKTQDNVLVLIPPPEPPARPSATE